MGRLRGGHTIDGDALVDKMGRPSHLLQGAGQEGGIAWAKELTGEPPRQAMMLAEKRNDANTLRQAIVNTVPRANMPPRASREEPISSSKYLSCLINVGEGFFGRIKCYRRSPARYDKPEEIISLLSNLARPAWGSGIYEPTA